MEPPTITPATTVGYSSYVEPNSTIPRLSRVGDSHIPGTNNHTKTAGDGAGRQPTITTRQPQEDVERGASAVRARTDHTTSGGPRETAANIKPAVDRGLRAPSKVERDQIYKKEANPTRSLHGSGATGGYTDGNGLQIRPTGGWRSPKASEQNRNPVTKRGNSNTKRGVEVREEEEILIGVRYHTKRV